jgi:hypothetical protein
MNVWDQVAAVSKVAVALRQRVEALEAASKQAGEADLTLRVEDLEARLGALLPLVDPDRLEVARACQRLGVDPKDLASRDPRPERTRAARTVFAELRCAGWALDRVAAATGYTVRGVQLNLERAKSS